MKAMNLEQIIGGKRFATKTATLLAGDNWWDGSNQERQGRNRYLYRSPRGIYFIETLTQWQGEYDHLAPVTMDEALSFFEDCDAHGTAVVEWAQAFPERVLEDA